MRLLRSNRFQILVVVLVATALPTLAWFQYQWLEELREAVHFRMERNLARGTFFFVRDFDGALGHIYRSFQVDFREEGDAGEQLALQYSDWVNEFRTPTIIERILWVDHDEQTGLTLHEFSGTDHLVRLDRWPDKIAHLERAFYDALEYAHLQHEKLLGPEPLQENIPALVVQQVIRRGRVREDDRRSVSWVVVILNERELVGKLVPELVEQHYDRGAESEFDVAIVDGDADSPERIVFESAAGMLDRSTAFDTQAEIFRLHPWEFPERSFVNRRALRILEDHNAPRWSLLARHSAGSLDAAVTQVRNRNLAISSGVLLLLGFSVLMMVVSTRRAQRLARQQMEFVAGISHELRTPLAVIRSAGENLEDVDSDDAARTRKYGAVINREGRRLSQMVEQVLLFARLQSGHREVQRRSTDIGRVLREAVDATAPILEEREIVVEQRLPADLPEIEADPTALKSAVQNLLSNAAKYGPRGGTVTLRARCAGAGEERELQIVVEDQGDGIAGNETASIFEPFYRGEQARRRQIEGSGLGLSLVREIVESHGGEVGISSTGSEGTAFFIRLPVEPDAG